MSKDLILLEYNEERGSWHYNPVHNNIPHQKPESYGWQSIAFTFEDKASIFTLMMDCKLHAREAAKQRPFKTEYIRREWKLFCFMYNEIISRLDSIPDTEKGFVKNNYDNPHVLAKLGHGSFSDIKENEELEPAWEYDPYNFIDSNI